MDVPPRPAMPGYELISRDERYIRFAHSSSLVVFGPPSFPLSLHLIDMASAGSSGSSPEIEVVKLTFSHNPSDTRVEPSLVDINISLPKGSRTILVGANGGELRLRVRYKAQHSH